MGTHGILTRTVADTAAFLDFAGGHVTGDPYWLKRPNIPFLDRLQQPFPNLKVGYLTSILPVGEPDSECQSSVARIVRQLELIGHSTIPQTIDLTPLIEPFKVVWSSAVAATGIPPEALSPMNRWVRSQSSTAGEYLQAVTQMQVFARQIVGMFDDIDVLITPTYMHPAIKVGEWQNLEPEATLERIINWILPCPPFNVTGQPAISIPSGFDSRGIPLGVQLVGKPNSEATILAIAAQLEDLSWSQLRPRDFV